MSDVDRAILHGVARRKMSDGRLPRSRPFRSLKVRGVGAACALCDAVISRRQHEIELLFMDSSRRPDVLRFHPVCLDAWRVVRDAAA